MPAIPESTRSSILLRLLDHAEHNWPQLAKVQARYHGSFAYITGVLPGGEQIPLFRLRYGGSAHSFGFAIYSPARDRYEDAVLLTGLPIGSPQEALDTACTLHLAALGYKPESWPPTDLRCHPLSLRNTTRRSARPRGWRDLPSQRDAETPTTPRQPRLPVDDDLATCKSSRARHLGVLIADLARSRAPAMPVR